jgi:8-oxo-dGTP pyrophosphatase MutT (NUDIX family)
VAEAALSVRDAATVVLMRHGAAGPEVLMGQRGEAAAFMPSKFVFPGGAVEPPDASVTLATPLNPVCAARLAEGGGPGAAALAAAAIREVWEETGLPLGRPGTAMLPEGWEGFARRGLLPDAAALRFVFRAITPPGRPRRYDARFFLADARAVAGDAEDFSAASHELRHLRWLPLADTGALDLPFITEVVLAEVAALAGVAGPPPPVPFFDNSGPAPVFRRIG